MSSSSEAAVRAPHCRSRIQSDLKLLNDFSHFQENRIVSSTPKEWSA